MKKKMTATVVSQNEISKGIFDLRLQTELAEEAHAGQFIGVYTGDPSKLLPRPISICNVLSTDKGKKDILRLVYRVTAKGSGTDEISCLKKDDRVDIIGILGNGYDLSLADGKRVVLMGGGIGIPPMLELATELTDRANSVNDDRDGMNTGAVQVNAVLGYRNNDLFLKNEFEAVSKVYVATEDGSVGTKGNVLDLMREEKLPCDIIMACGPMPMLRAIAAYAKENGIKAYISLEERMACGVGACLGCVTKTRKVDSHSHVNNARICTDGPVFDADDLDI